MADTTSNPLAELFAAIAELPPRGAWAGTPNREVYESLAEELANHDMDFRAVLEFLNRAYLAAADAAGEPGGGTS